MDNGHTDVTRTGAVPGMTVFTAKLIERLKLGKPGDVLTDSELKEVCGKDCDCKGDGYSYLGSAVRHCIRHHNVVWKRINRAGCIKCLNSDEISQLGEDAPKRIGRVCNRTLRTMKAADLSAMTDANKTSYNLSLAQLGFLSHLAGSAGRKRLESRNVTGPLDFGKLLDNMTKRE